MEDVFFQPIVMSVIETKTDLLKKKQERKRLLINLR